MGTTLTGIEIRCGTIGHGVILAGILGVHLIDGPLLGTIDGDIITGLIIYTMDTVGIITTGGTIMVGTIGTIILIIIEEVVQHILMDVEVLT